MNKGTLYSNNHPNTTIHGLGFKDAATAKKSIKTLQQKVNSGEITKIRMMQTINTLLQRAKYHPYITKNMQQAIKIFCKWMKNYKAK